MKKLLWISGVFLLVTLGLLTPAWLQTELIEHHGQMIDANSPARGCLSCHDGATAKFVSFCTVRCDFSGAHSLLRRYPPARKAAQYAPTAVIQARGIKLENGQVTCNSCHDLRKSTPNHLVMENTGSRLCLTCHIGK